MIGGLEMIKYIKCGNCVEVVEIYSDNDAKLQLYLVDDNKVVKIYNVQGESG